MNERIRELAKEAEAYADYYAFIADEPEKDIFVRRFAELIIEECAEIFEGLYTDQQRPERIDTRIKRHFGVG